MPNFTFKITDCAIPEKPFANTANTYLSGRLRWREGSIDFDKNFHTFSKHCIDIILAKCGAEGRFEVTGTVTKKHGKKGTQWENKMFEEYVIDDIKLTNGIESKEWVNPLDEQVDEEIPF